MLLYARLALVLTILAPLVNGAVLASVICTPCTVTSTSLSTATVTTTSTSVVTEYPQTTTRAWTVLTFTYATTETVSMAARTTYIGRTRLINETTTTTICPTASFDKLRMKREVEATDTKCQCHTKTSKSVTTSIQSETVYSTLTVTTTPTSYYYPYRTTTTAETSTLYATSYVTHTKFKVLTHVQKTTIYSRTVTETAKPYQTPANLTFKLTVAGAPDHLGYNGQYIYQNTRDFYFEGLPYEYEFLNGEKYLRTVLGLTTNASLASTFFLGTDFFGDYIPQLTLASTNSTCVNYRAFKITSPADIIGWNWIVCPFDYGDYYGYFYDGYTVNGCSIDCKGYLEMWNDLYTWYVADDDLLGPHITSADMSYIPPNHQTDENAFVKLKVVPIEEG